MAGLSTLYVVAVAWVAAARFNYPFELEWLEGATFESALRLYRGQAIFPPASLDYVPLNYPPLYHALGALAMHVLGADLATLRLVSMLSAVAIGALAYHWVRLETGRAWAGVLAVGLFAACFRRGGAWLDVARVDSLALALLLAAVVAVRVDRSPRRGPALAGLLLALAFLTKQSAPLFFLPVALWSLVEDRRRGLRLAAWSIGAVLAAGLVVDVATGGGFRFYVFEIIGRHGFQPALTGRFPIDDVLRPLWPSLLVIAAALALPAVRRPLRPLGVLGAFALGCIGIVWGLRMYVGCYDNVLMPAHLVLAMLSAIALARLVDARHGGAAATAARVGDPDDGSPSGTPPGSALAGLLAVAASVAVVLQLALLGWDPRAQIPSAADRAAGERLVADLRNDARRILLPAHPNLVRLAGRTPQAHEMALTGVGRPHVGPNEHPLMTELRDALVVRAWDLLILDTNDWYAELAWAVGYRPVDRVFSDQAAFWPVTGMRTRPELVWMPIERMPPGAETMIGPPPWNLPTSPR